VRHAGREPRPVLAQDRHERVVPVSLVQEHRPAGLGGELELQPKDPFLVLVRREIAEVIETAFARGAHLGLAHQRTQRRDVGIVELARVVRMDSAVARKVPGAERASSIAARLLSSVLPGDHHVVHAGGACGPDDLSRVVVEAVVREVEADVDDGRVHEWPLW